MDLSKPVRLARSDYRNVLVAVLVTAFLYLPELGITINLRWDAAVYYILGTSLAEGKGYRLLSEPGEIQAIQYPPLLPAAVAAHEVVLGTKDIRVVGQALRHTYFALTLAYAAATYILARQYLPGSCALPISVLSLIHI